jgi:predicted outer membrane repeat protein
VDTSFDNNRGLSGGAIDSELNLSISGGVFYSNTAIASRGGALLSDGQTLITGTTFLSNTADNGGGAISVGHALTVTASTFQGNRADFAPGGAILNEGQLLLDAVAVISNSALGGYGNGISSSPAGALTLRNSTLSGNPDFLSTALAAGSRPAGSPSGGGLVALGPVTVTNGTITGNDEGGLVTGSLISITVKNSIIANNFGRNCYGPIHSLGHNLVNDNTCPLAASGDLTNTNPLLGPLADNGGPTLTQALLPGSPAINHGDNNGCPLVDQRGFLRLGGCDIGAFEFAFRTLLPLVRN